MEDEGELYYPKMKTPEQLKEYRHEYYEQHKDHKYQQFLKWCRDKPEKALAIQKRWRDANPHYYRDYCRDNPAEAKARQKRWRDANPHYYRDYMRKRKAVTESLIFQFLNNGLGDMDDFITYLQNRGTPEQHIKWFKTDVQKHVNNSP